MNTGRAPRHGGSQRSEKERTPVILQRVRPVYADAANAFQPRPPATANTGLFYDRYANIWSGKDKWKPETPRKGKSVRQVFLDEVVEHARGIAPHVSPFLGAFHDRRAALWRATGGRDIGLSVAAPLVSGIGMAHALEVGFVWDRNLGVPFLPASSLKGAARAWAEQWQGLKGDDIKRIFGDVEIPGAGSVVFHGLYPAEPPALRVDVVNPHFKAYYDSEGRVSPADWLSPNPVFFLTVSAGAPFVTGLCAMARADSGDLDIAEKCLRDALLNLGVGAKTAVGYGIFSP